MPFDKVQLETYSSDGHNVVLAEPLTYLTRLGQIITVPVGSTSNGASVPSFLWSIFPPFGKYWRAALLHDYLYGKTTLPKAKCDKLFLEAMLDSGVPRLKAETIYLNVKWLGFWAFKKCRSGATPTI